MFNNSIDNLQHIDADSISVSGLGSGVVHSDSGGNLSSSLIVNADVSNSAALAYSKLNLAGNVVNADISNSAAVAYSKLNLANSIVNADIVNGTIADNKLSSAIDTTSTANTIVKRDASADIFANVVNGSRAVFTLDDSTTATAPDHILLRGATNNNRQMIIGYNTTTNSGNIQCTEQTVSTRPLCLQPISGHVIVGAETANSVTSALEVVLSSPPSLAYGGRLVVGGRGSGDTNFSIGLFNNGVNKRIVFGGHNADLTAWADSYCQDLANLYINNTGGSTIIGPTTFTGERFKVEGATNITGTLINGADIVSTGNISIGAGTQSINGTVRFSGGRFETRESALWKRIPGARFAVIDAGGTINTTFANYGITSVVNGSTGNYTVSFADWGTPFAQLALFASNLGFVTWTGGGNTDIFVNTYNTSSALSNIISFTIIVLT